MVMKTVKMHWEMEITLTKSHLDQRVVMIRQDVYGSVRGQRKNDYLTSINAGDEEEDAEDELVGPMAAAKAAYSAPKRFIEEAARHGQGDDPFAETRTKTIAERQSNYQARARQRQISPERADMFADQTPDIRDRSYAQIMKEQMLREETVCY
ncbi:unnamed protein product [Brugia timori]|uniref:PRP21_like_P domain-containing protein n=1 Tax=Brugia timori TaxID=42155 RepID=A0A0R3QGB7_9BILA|nr:unnamed protein product [Brugia timori]